MSTKYLIEACRRCNDPEFSKHIDISLLGTEYIECAKCNTPRYVRDSKDLGYWLIDPTKHNPHVIKGGHYLIPLDYEWEGISPFRGLEVTVLEIFHYTRAGFDCTCQIHVTPEEIAARYTVAIGIAVTADEIKEWHGDEIYSRGPIICIEHETFCLDPIED